MLIQKRNIHLWLLTAYFWAIVHIFIPHHHHHYDNDRLQNHQQTCEVGETFQPCEKDHQIGQLHSHQPYLKVNSNQYFITQSFYCSNFSLQFLNYYLKPYDNSYISKFFASSLHLRAPPALS
ncbi:MAG: hypothetical protein Q8K98_00285 [Bacteroidota bacterium]|nr:hypothetical protein [Bacteroidota bacterium]